MNDSPPHAQDIRLVEQARRGEEGAVDRLIDRLHCIPAILKRKNRRLPYPLDPHELQDLAQEVFAKVWGKLDTFAGQGCIEAWVYRFCHHVMLNAQARHTRRNALETVKAAPHDDLLEEEPDPSHERVSLGERIALLEAVDALDRPEAEVIELKHFEGLSFTEIAERLSISSNSAKTRYYRGLRRLEQRLSPIFREEAP